MFDHMLVVAPTAIFLVALALFLDLPRRLLNGLGTLRPNHLARGRGG